MDRMTPLEESHDVAESLQRKVRGASCWLVYAAPIAALWRTASSHHCRDPARRSHPSMVPQIEQRDSCERCFTHVDYSWTDHSRDDEHIPPHLQPAYAPPE